MDIEKIYKKQKIKKLYQKFIRTVIYIILIFGVIGGINYFLDKNEIAAQYEPKYSESEMLTFSENYIVNNFSESDISDFQITNHEDEKGHVINDISFIIDGSLVQTQMVMEYSDGSFQVRNGLILNEVAESEEVAEQKVELPGEKLSGENIIEVENFIKNYFNSVNSNTSSNFYDKDTTILPNTYFDTETVSIKQATHSELIYVEVDIDYVILDVDSGEEKYRTTYNYIISYNTDTQKIENIEY